MKKTQLSQLITYCLVAVLCVGTSFLISLKFLSKSRAQEGEAETAAANMAAKAAAPAAGQAAPPAGTPNPPAAPVAGQAPATGQAVPPAGQAVAKPGAAAAAAAKAAAGAGAGSQISELEGFLEPFIYDVVNRRDPFLAYAEYVPVDTSAPTRPLSPAQRFDLDQLRLVGIMWDIRDPKAMFMDPEAEVIVLGRDEGIGNRNGYIASIREGEVVVVEAIRKRGDIIYKTRVLRIER